MPFSSSNLLVVFGALRSGTTLLRLMLDAHPRLSAPGETDFMFDHLATVEGVVTLDQEKLRNDWIFRLSKMNLPSGTPAEQVTALAQQCRKGRDLGIMVLHRGIDRALDFFPDLRIVHLLRDPRDVARSSIPMGWAGNVYCGVDHWINTEATWTAVQARLNPGQALEVHYEDLIRSPEQVLTRICEFAGADFAPSMLEYDQKTSYSKPDPRKVDQWRRKLTPREIGLVESKLGASLTSRGYVPSGHPPVPSTKLTDLALRLQSKQKVWGHRFANFGLVDPIMETLARRMHLSSLARSAQERIEQKFIARL